MGRGGEEINHAPPTLLGQLEYRKRFVRGKLGD